MTTRSNDALLHFGEKIALVLQGMCALAGVVLVVMFIALTLISLKMLPGVANPSDFELLEASPFGYLSLPVMLAAAVGVLFLFFGKMRAIIRSASEGDPFIAENAQRLITMAWLLLAFQVLNLVIGSVRLYVANLATGSGDRLDFSIYDLQGLLVILVLFILARVFRHGAAMREDLEGTV
ncbi:MAG: DUF2975 domain-containing protein [Citromicrobium sp.]|nr:MAG: DUF2975 domain-containing protein [Citromicrobium sp.]